MDLITLGAALNGAKTQTESYVDSHFKAGSNITITDNVDGTQTIAASGEVSSEDTVARGEIADHVANTSNPHDVKGDQVELHTYAKATEKVAIASGDKVNEALGKLEKKIDDNVINDSTITIKKNGTIVDSFTTNASSGKEINIAVPSTAADVGALADTVKYAGSASAGGSATSAVKLDNAADSGSLTQPIFFDNGKPKATSYSLAKSVPSDAQFTDTTYESKAAVQSGSDVSLVTTGEKYTWNNKQNAISTSSRLAGNAVNMTGYAKASEQAAISSGDVMTTAIGKLEKKADDNKNNILLNTENGVGNVLTPYTTDNAIVELNDNAITYSIATTGELTISKSTAVTGTSYIRHTFTVKKSGTYIFTTQANSSATTKSDAYIQDMTGTPVVVARDYGTEQEYNYTAGTTYRITCRVSDGFSGSVVFKPMLVTKAQYDAGLRDFQQYALPNTELTALEKKNEANILSDNILSTSFTWGNGYIDRYTGKINSSSASYFSQPFTLHAGEKIVVRTQNTNIGIICTTTANSVAVGDTLTVLRYTSGTAQEETYDYIATEDIKIVICVLASNYTAYTANHNTTTQLGSYTTASIVELTEITNNFNNVKSVITNTNTTFTPDTNCHYLVLIQASTSSALYAVYKTSAINIAKITGTMTSDSVTESGGVVTITTTAWSMISIIKIGKSSN